MPHDSSLRFSTKKRFGYKVMYRAMKLTALAPGQAKVSVSVLMPFDVVPNTSPATNFVVRTADDSFPNLF